jgi:hypothetical protein
MNTLGWRVAYACNIDGRVLILSSLTINVEIIWKVSNVVPLQQGENFEEFT